MGFTIHSSVSVMIRATDHLDAVKLFNEALEFVVQNKDDIKLDYGPDSG